MSRFGVLGNAGRQRRVLVLRFQPQDAEAAGGEFHGCTDWASTPNLQRRLSP
eukprot:SAG22_NODE_7864_length_701_cov_1.220930_1_plen_51_part_10